MYPQVSNSDMQHESDKTFPRRFVSSKSPRRFLGDLYKVNLQEAVNLQALFKSTAEKILIPLHINFTITNVKPLPKA